MEPRSGIQMGPTKIFFLYSKTSQRCQQFFQVFKVYPQLANILIPVSMDNSTTRTTLKKEGVYSVPTIMEIYDNGNKNKISGVQQVEQYILNILQQLQPPPSQQQEPKRKAKRRGLDITSEIDHGYDERAVYQDDGYDLDEYEDPSGYIPQSLAGGFDKRGNRIQDDDDLDDEPDDSYYAEDDDDFGPSEYANFDSPEDGYTPNNKISYDDDYDGEFHNNDAMGIGNRLTVDRKRETKMKQKMKKAKQMQRKKFHARPPAHDERPRPKSMTAAAGALLAQQRDMLLDREGPYKD